MKPISRRSFLRAAGAGALTAAGAGAFGRYSTTWLDRNEYVFELPNWRRRGFKIGYFSDSHLTDDAAVRVSREALEYAISTKPDVLIFGGDFVEKSSGVSLGRIAEAYAPLRSCGIPAYGVLGNHDYAVYHPERVVAAARAAGWEVLRNEAAMVGDVTIFGLDCLTFGHCDISAMAPFQGSDNLLVVLHEPDGVDRLPTYPSLMLAGHSHGGQICLPGGAPLTTPLGAHRYVKGWYPEAKVPLFVSRGVGVTGIRLRCFCRPESSLLRLEPRGAAV